MSQDANTESTETADEALFATERTEAADQPAEVEQSEAETVNDGEGDSDAIDGE